MLPPRFGKRGKNQIVESTLFPTIFWWLQINLRTKRSSKKFQSFRWSRKESFLPRNTSNVWVTAVFCFDIKDDWMTGCCIKWKDLLTLIYLFLKTCRTSKVAYKHVIKWHSKVREEYAKKSVITFFCALIWFFRYNTNIEVHSYYLQSSPVHCFLLTSTIYMYLMKKYVCRKKYIEVTWIT